MTPVTAVVYLSTTQPHHGHVTTSTSSSTSGRLSRGRSTSGSVIPLVTVHPRDVVDDCKWTLELRVSGNFRVDYSVS